MTHLFATILNMSITASYVAIAVILVRFCLRKVPKIFSYAMWIALLVRLVFPISFNSRISFLNLFKASNQSSPRITIDQVSGINNLAGSMPSSITQTTSAQLPIISVLEIASIVWIVGIVILISYSVFSYFKLVSTVKVATLLSDNIYISERITTPFVMGFIKPKIYIPIDISENELPYILAHERTHIRRLDYLVKPLAFLVLTLHWFNPLIWLSFKLMSKDMETSCDENVIKKMGNEIRGIYANTLLSLSVRKSGLLIGSPLSFGESNVKSRIKNIMDYRKPALWIIVIAIIITATLIVALATNPNNEKIQVSNTGYDLEYLIDNKTPYVGNFSKVVALIDAMPFPKDVFRDTIKLKTHEQPYEITVFLDVDDSSSINRGAFYTNTILLFSLIDNVDIITYTVNTESEDGIPNSISYLRSDINEIIGDDVLNYTDSPNTLENLIDKIDNQSSTDEIANYIDEITSSPKESSNPNDYIKTHQQEYEKVLMMGDEALSYLLYLFDENEVSNDLRGYIIMSICKDLLGDNAPTSDESMTPLEWYSQL